MSAQIFVLVSPIIGMLYELIKNESTTIPKVLVVSIIGFIMLLLRHRYGNKVIRNKILYGIRKKSKWDKLPDIFLSILDHFKCCNWDWLIHYYKESSNRYL